MDLADIVARYGPIVQDHQLFLADRLPELGGGFDIDLVQGVLTLRQTGRRCRVQLLGSEAQGTWMWAWANQSFAARPELVDLVSSVRAWGERNGVAELTSPGLRIGEWAPGAVLTGLNCAAVALGLSRAPGIYVCVDRQRGARLYTALIDPDLHEPAGDLLLRIALRYPRILALAGYPPERGGIPIHDWGAGLRTYAAELGVGCEEVAGGGLLLRAGERTARATFQGGELTIET